MASLDALDLKWQGEGELMYCDIYLLQSGDGQLSACTLEDGLTQPYVTCFVLDSAEFRKLYSSRLIDDPVLVIRNDVGEAVLQN